MPLTSSAAIPPAARALRLTNPTEPRLFWSSTRVVHDPTARSRGNSAKAVYWCDVSDCWSIPACPDTVTATVGAGASIVAVVVGSPVELSVAGSSSASFPELNACAGHPKALGIAISRWFTPSASVPRSLELPTGHRVSRW